MLPKNALGVCVSVVLVAAACGGSKSSGGNTGGASTGGAGTGNGTATGGSTASGMTSSSGNTTTSSSGNTTTSSSGNTTTSSSGSTTTSSSTSSSGTTSCANFNVVGGIFQATEPWNTAVDTAPKDAQSDTIINWLVSAGGWGNGNKLQIDTSINIQCADATTPMKPFVVPGGCDPDCDNVSTFPVPAGGAVEGEAGYACNGGGDCHLLVVDKANNKLYEMYQAFYPPSPTVFNSGGGAIIWDLTKAYPPNLRGDGCTSADAGGFPIAAMLFTADEVAAGHIDHAIRFILPNARIHDGPDYVHPATHTGVNTATVTRPNAPPYGVHFRLKPTFNLATLPSNGARTIAKALQKYGMFLSDGGNIAFTAADDAFTKAKWADANVNVDPKALSVIQVSDFEVVNLGTLITTGDNCIRNP